MKDVLQYENLVEAYYEGLHSRLRSFRVGPDFLESWVHDEDHERSLVALFEAASESGIESLEVSVARTTLGNRPLLSLQSSLKEFGNVVTLEKKDAFHFRVEFSAQTVWQVSPRYSKALLERANRVQFEGQAPEYAFSATDKGVTLSCETDEKGIVQSAQFCGASGLLRPLLDLLCEELLHRPLQEGSEHAVLRLENRLRDRSLTLSQAGLITPENADPIFSFANRLIRSLFKSYLEVGHSVTWNDWEDGLSESWRALNDEEKKARLQQELTALEPLFQLPQGTLEVIAIKKERRVYLARNAETKSPQFGSQLIRLERALKERCERGLELVLESLEDKNRREGRTTIAGRNLNK